MTVDYILYQLGDFYKSTTKLVDNDSLFVDISEGEVLSFKDKNGVTNLERIYYQYDYYRRADLKEEFDAAMSQINSGSTNVSWDNSFVIGTQIALPKDKINRAVAARDGGTGQIVGNSSSDRSTNTLNFFAESLDAIINSEGYVKKDVYQSINSGNTVTKEIPNATVKIWCRALTDRGSSSDGDKDDVDLNGTWIDVSKYVHVLQTNTDINGGNFSISLAPLIGYYDESKKSWEVDRKTLFEYDKNIVSQSNLFSKDRQGNSVRSNFLFNMILQENDVVYIAFEPLELEEENTASGPNGDGISRESEQNEPWYPGRIFDMIGLIDSVGENFNAQSNDVSIEITGRDLSKLLIEDGSYMYYSLWDGHNFLLNRENPLIKRSLIDNKYFFFAEPRYRTVSEAVLFIINVLANIKVAPDDSMKGLSMGSLEEIEVEWDSQISRFKRANSQSLRFILRRLRASYNSEDVESNSEFEEQAVIEALFNEINVWAKQLSENNTNVYDIKYSDYQSRFLTLSLPSIPGNSDQAYRGGNIQGVVNPNGVGSDTIDMVIAALNIQDSTESEEARRLVSSRGVGIWKAVKLAFDDNISDRKLADVSLGSPDGSIIDLIWNYAQMPWVETIMDTYDKHFHITFRMPPWDKKRIRDVIKSKWFDNLFVIEENVIASNLSWDTEVYSLYQLDYKASVWGGNEQLAAVIPTVPLPDYAEMFGTRQWRQSSNLLPLSDLDDSQSAINRSYVRNSGIDDLTWAIETTAYLPFTRTGTITIHGDRRFKKGMWFHYRPTNEIFYIEGVSHSYNGTGPIDRVTTLQVRRGMILDYVDGSKKINTKEGQKELSYFNILDIVNLRAFLKSQLSVNEDGTVDSKPQEDSERNFRVNKEIFNFFRTRSQFKSINVLSNPLTVNTNNGFLGGISNIG